MILTFFYYCRDTGKLSYRFMTAKSRSDGTLLTGGFNLRNRLNKLPFKSRRDDTLSLHSVVPAGLGGEYRTFFGRRLKSTVNKMPSLRDFLPINRYFAIDMTLF